MDKKDKTSLVQTTIQVRGYSYDLRDWVYGSLVPYTNNEPAILTESEDHKSVIVHKVVPETVTNYTGHKDMNGRDIYVADALRIEHMGVYYVYSSADNKLEIAPLNYKHEGIPFSNVTKFTLDLDNADEKPAIEVIGNTLLQTLAVAIADYVDKYRKEEKIIVTEVNENLIDDPNKIHLSGADIKVKDDCEKFEQDKKDVHETNDDYEHLEDEDDYDYIDDYDDVDWGDIENWEVVMDEREEEIRHQDNKDFIENPNIGFINPEFDKSIPQFRALSTDLETWVYGDILHNNYDFTKPVFIYDKAGKSVNIHDVLIDTISRATPYKDKDGEVIYTKDIMLINGDTFVVVEYVPGIGFAVIHLDEYATEKSNDPSCWGHIVHQTWSTYPQVLKVIGNTINGVIPEWEAKILDAIDAGQKFIGWTNEDIVNKNKKSEVEDDPKFKDPIYLIAKQIDAVTYAVDKNVTGVYIDDYLSNNNDIIMLCQWQLANGYQIHAFLNTATNENAVYYGKWDLVPRYKWKHTLISYSPDNFSDMIDNVTNLILMKQDPEQIIKSGIWNYPNIPYNSKYTKYIEPDYRLERIFGNQENISHKVYENGVIASYLSYDLYKSVMYRAMTSSGRWVFGYLDEENPDYIWALEDNLKKTKRKPKRVKMNYITGSLCSNTYLASSTYDYIFSGDIVDYEGKGRFVVYHTSDIDPADILNPVSNEDGQKFIYVIEYDVLKDVMLRKYEKSEDDSVNEAMARVTAGFKWTPITISEWLRNWHKLTIVGNITESIIIDKSVCYNTKDFVHDEDPLPIMFERFSMVSVSKKGNEDYWKEFYDDTSDVEEEVSAILNCILDTAVVNPEYDWQIFHNSIDNKIVKAIYLNAGNTAIRLLWGNIHAEKINDEGIATVMIGEYKDYVTNLGLYKYAVPFEEAFNDVIDIMTGNNTDIRLKYNFEFSMPDLKETKKYDVLKNAVAKQKLSFANSKEYISYVREKIFKGNEKKMKSVECRALNEYGRWVIGSFNGNTILENGDPDKATSYLRETLGFNTYVLDASGRYIYDHDVICIHGECSNTMAIIEHMPFLKYLYKFNEMEKSDIADTPVYRVLYKQWKDGYMRDDFKNVPFVPFTYDWFIRNRERFIVLSDLFTSNIETDDVNL